MKICVRSWYSYAQCEAEFEIEELLKETQAYLDKDFGSVGGVSLKKGEWERVIVTEKDIINVLSYDNDHDKDLYFLCESDNKQIWKECTLFAEISDFIYEYCDEKEEIIEWGDRLDWQVSVQDNLIREDF